MKKYLALLLAVLMLAAVFAGCASKETTTDTPAASTETAEPAKTEETAATEETTAEELFYVINDEKMQETVDSIKEYGVLNPCIVRPREGGGYEIISGHRRKYACQLAGKAKIPAIIRNYTDDEATIIMVDSVRP